jgi:hypothetical protein
MRSPKFGGRISLFINMNRFSSDEGGFFIRRNPMNDTQFLQQFESATLSSFPHADHIRMAWLYLRRDGWDEGYTQIQAGLKHFATVLGVADKYHETITRFWALLIQHCIEDQPDIEDFTAFIKAYPILLDQTAMNRHYSDAVLWGTDARQMWVIPDLIPMP